MPSRIPLTQRLSCLAVAALFALNGTGFAAQSEFYTLNERWAKENVAPKTSPQAAIEEVFSKAAESQNTNYMTPGAPPPPSLRRTLAELAGAGTVEVEVGQSLFVEDIGGLVKFVTTDEGIATVESVNTETLRILGSEVGSTFLHIWNAAGRKTLPLRILPPKLSATPFRIRETDKFEKTRPFRLGYDNARTANYTGEKYRTMERSSVDFTQNFKLTGDTPYGSFDSHMQTQKAEGKTLLTDAQVALLDGKVGPFKNFNAAAGDSPVSPDLMVFPSARIRGGLIEHWSDDKRVSWSAFRGREDSSIIGVLTPGVVSERTLDKYLSGGVMDFKVNDSATLKTGYFTGGGEDREDELHGQGGAAKTTIKLGEHVLLENEVDNDSERFAQKHAALAKFEKLRVRSEFRDISRNFVTLLGSPSQQGELGNRIDISAEPSAKWSGSASWDVFRDRLIPNPSHPEAFNSHTDLQIAHAPCDDVNLTFNFQDLDDIGRLGPSRQRTYGTQYSERFDAWGRRATFFTRYQYRTNFVFSNPDSYYRDNQVVVGMHTPIFWGINFSIEKEWNALEEPEIGRYTHPNALVYTWDYSHQIGASPFFMDARLRIRDEEDTESVNSFMIGEDSTEISGGIYYREFEDFELFLTGSFTQYVPESQDIADARVQAQFYTGMRYSFDTGYRWGVVGSFEGYVFKDQNGDGKKQAEEPGFADMLVTSSDGKQTSTDKNGYYLLKGVGGKQATITLDSSKIPYGFVPTGPASQKMEVVQNKTVKLDFGLTPRSEVTGIVYNDMNGNGKYDLTDAGVSKVQVKLENGASARSNNLGVYTISGVVAGEHTASIVLNSLPEGYLPVNVPKKTFTLYEGIRYELNFPLVTTRVLTGRVFLDENGNSTLDAGETGLSDIPLTFAGRSAVTDKDGWYLFENVEQGSYPLAVDASKVPAGFRAPEPVKIDMPAGAVTMSDINVPLSIDREKIPAAEEEREEAPAGAEGAGEITGLSG